jgi:hypothetical protein
VQEDPIANAYCTVPAFSWKKMFYPELQMPYMPVSQPSKEQLLEGAEEGRLELFEGVELAMMRIFSAQ